MSNNSNKNNQKKKGNPNSKSNEYVSPLIDELGLQAQHVGEGVILFHDRDSGRVLVDIDVETRRGLSSTGKNIKIATASYGVSSKKKLTINSYDKDFSDEEMDTRAVFLKKEKRRKEQEKELKALE